MIISKLKISTFIIFKLISLERSSQVDQFPGAMFQQKGKENNTAESNNQIKQMSLNFSRQKSKTQKERKISNLRNIYTSQALDWHLPIDRFNQLLGQSQNQYSLLITLFEVAEDPMWRSKSQYLCSLIKALHNVCADKNGYYLAQITNIPNYHQKLCKIFSLNDNMVQQHFKLFIMIYLSYNSQFCMLDEAEVALGLIEAAKNRTDQTFLDYLWLVCQIRVDWRAISKLLKIGIQVIQKIHQNAMADHGILPIVTTLANYAGNENDHNILHQLVEDGLFQNILLYSLTRSQNFDVRQQALLLCSNLIGYSPEMAFKVLSSHELIQAASSIECEEQQAFRELVIFRKEEYERRKE